MFASSLAGIQSGYTDPSLVSGRTSLPGAVVRGRLRGVGVPAGTARPEGSYCVRVAA